MQTTGWAVAVSYLEWIRWVATGWFRCADRAVWLEGPEDQSAMDALMDRGPDLQAADDQGFVIACLTSEPLGRAQRIGSARSLSHAWLSLDMVETFLPVSNRGARLLEADAERASVRLGAPVLEHLWSDWRNRRLEEESHRRGILLCTALGMQPPVLSDLPLEAADVLAGRAPAPNAERSRSLALEGTRGFGWAAALSVALMDESLREVVKESPRYTDAQAKVKNLRGDFDLWRPLLADDGMVALSTEINALIWGHGGKSLPVSAMAVALHYRDIASSGRELSLHALLEDLATLAMEDPQAGALCAYFIGRSMENVAVTTLLYQSNPTRYKALSPSISKENLNVMRRAAEKCEAEQARAAVAGPRTFEMPSTDVRAPEATEPPESPGDHPSVSETTSVEADATVLGTVTGDAASAEKATSESAMPETVSVSPGSTEFSATESTSVEPSDQPRQNVLTGDKAETAAEPERSIGSVDPVPTDLFPGAQTGEAKVLGDSRSRKNKKKR